MKSITFSLILLVFCLATFAQKSSDKDFPKLTADEIVSKHLDSIGKQESILAAKPLILAGTGTFSTKMQPGSIGGPAQFASVGDMMLFAMVLNANNYPFEKFAYDGKAFSTAVLPSGNSSGLSNFLKNNNVIVKRGLFGGVLRKNWPLLSRDKDVKIESAGIAKLGDRRLYKLKLTTSGIGEMTISIFFDPEDFHHVRTEYFYRTGQLTSPNPNRPGQLGGVAPSTYSLTEEFSNFGKVDDLVLPLTYVVEYESNTGKAVTWSLTFSQAFNDQTLDASAFKVS